MICTASLNEVATSILEAILSRFGKPRFREYLLCPPEKNDSKSDPVLPFNEDLFHNTDDRKSELSK